MEPAHLDDRAVIALSGPEARPFLQGLVTNDVMALKPGADTLPSNVKSLGRR